MPLKSVADVNPTFMPTDEKGSTLLTLLAIESQVTELRLRVMAAAEDLAEREGFHTSAGWLAHHGRVRRSDAAADLGLAQTLARELPVLAAALREARVNVAQARVIGHAVSELPRRIGEDLIARAEAELVRLAEQHDPKELTVLGRRILEVVDPERFEDEERRKLEAAEKRAQEKQRLRLRAIGDGTTRINGVVPDAVAARLATYLHAFTNPRRSDGAVRKTSDEQSNVEKNGVGHASTTRGASPRRSASCSRHSTRGDSRSMAATPPTSPSPSRSRPSRPGSGRRPSTTASPATGATASPRARPAVSPATPS
ncbi:hypothetical protein GCM10007231_25010 [Nocardioides daphniae]|uniref:DUF222 domain-containing protein n=1 Tax=Nocardioides daphniae TaxID=402297 RepID=A0A4P7UB68_9ACTN|nr:DUF222 domain-containing protein [Nocardioides daphniae]QCC77373.1 DUF222 domain-containing protein [Nocardioides daphniae]GGD24811.1 hypothetical protein GCM10007231_25010 [Nocardioides daphniae]